MANLPELRPGERSAEAEGAAVLRNASPVRFAAIAAAIFVAVVQLGAPGRSDGPPAFLQKALGSSDSQASRRSRCATRRGWCTLDGRISTPRSRPCAFRP